MRLRRSAEHRRVEQVDASALERGSIGCGLFVGSEEAEETPDQSLRGCDLVIVLGGAGNYPGALVGGLLLGLVEQLASLFLTTQLSEAVAYVLLVVVLLIRPSGLLGGRQT